MVANDSTWMWPDEHGVVGHEDPVAQHAVVADMDVGHQVVVRPEPGEPLFLLGAPVDGDRFAEHVVVADLDPGGLPLVGVILGLAADDREGMNDVVLAQGRVAEQANVGDQPAAPADLHVRADDAIGADLDVVGDLGARVDARGVRNDRGHGHGFLGSQSPLSLDRASSHRSLGSGQVSEAGHRGPDDSSCGDRGVDHDEPDLGLGGHGVAHPGDRGDARRILLDPFGGISSRSWSPGTTGRRSLTPSTEASMATRPRPGPRSRRSRTPPAWAIASMIRTPGMMGRPGQCPWKNGSLTLTFLIATSDGSGPDLEHPVDQQHGIAVGKDLDDPLDIERSILTQGNRRAPFGPLPFSFSRLWSSLRTRAALV